MFVFSIPAISCMPNNKIEKSFANVMAGGKDRGSESLGHGFPITIFLVELTFWNGPLIYKREVEGQHDIIA